MHRMLTKFVNIKYIRPYLSYLPFHNYWKGAVVTKMLLDIYMRKEISSLFFPLTLNTQYTRHIAQHCRHHSLGELNLTPYIFCPISLYLICLNPISPVLQEDRGRHI